MKKLTAMVMAAMAAAGAWAATAAFSYQGRLMNADGTAPLSGHQNVQLRLYDTPTEGEVLWGRSYAVLLDANGLFNVEVSDATGSALAGTSGNPLEKVFAMNGKTTIYVGLTVSGTSGEIAPRQKLLAVPYATFAMDVAEAKSDFTVAGTLTVKNLKVEETLTAEAINVSGAVGASSIAATGNATVKGDLTVNGTITGIGTVPLNGIIMWSGSTVPDGWALCDGSNGTPDLRGRFIVGAGQGSGLSNYAIGAKGGEEKHTLSVEEMPKHSHSYSFKGADIKGSWKDSNYFYNQSEKYSHNDNTRSTDNTGGGQAHENRPPYYALAFIMRVR